MTVDGDELPLLDGGAAHFADALTRLDLPRGRALRVTREAVLEHGRSVYRFAPGAATRVRVEVDFPPPVGRQCAEWGGDADDFVARIAPARTFGWAHEIERSAQRAARRGGSRERARLRRARARSHGAAPPDAGRAGAPQAPRSRRRSRALRRAAARRDRRLRPGPHRNPRRRGACAGVGHPRTEPRSLESRCLRLPRRRASDCGRRRVLRIASAALDAPAPPTLPALAHPTLTDTFEITVAGIDPGGGKGAGVRVVPPRRA